MNFIAYERVARRAGQHIIWFPALWAFVDTYLRVSVHVPKTSQGVNSW
jgi:hypothetical protein